MNGQLTPKEREFLHQSVLEWKPKIVLEVGTWKGGGSTWQIVKALEVNRSGVLYTCETDCEFFDEAARIYTNNSHVIMHLMASSDLIRFMVDAGRIPDFIFLDGEESESATIKELQLIEPHVKPGCIFMCHDWDPPSVKAKLLRPYLEKSLDWKIIQALTSPESVGMVKAIRI